MLILFGIDAPDSLKEYYYTIEATPIVEKIISGMTLRIDEYLDITFKLSGKPNFLRKLEIQSTNYLTP